MIFYCLFTYIYYIHAVKVIQLTKKLTIISMKKRTKVIAGIHFSRLPFDSVPTWASDESNYIIWQQACQSTHGYTLWHVSAGDDEVTEYWGTFNECVKYLDSKLTTNMPSFKVNDSVSFTEDYTDNFDVYTIKSINENGTIQLKEMFGTFLPTQFTIVHNFINQ